MCARSFTAYGAGACDPDGARVLGCAPPWFRIKPWRKPAKRADRFVIGAVRLEVSHVVVASVPNSACC